MKSFLASHLPLHRWCLRVHWAHAPWHWTEDRELWHFRVTLVSKHLVERDVVDTKTEYKATIFLASQVKVISGATRCNYSVKHGKTIAHNNFDIFWHSLTNSQLSFGHGFLWISSHRVPRYDLWASLSYSTCAASIAALCANPICESCAW